MAATRKIEDFKNTLRGGVRPNLFNVVINFPGEIVTAVGGNTLQDQSSFLCRSAQLPASTQGLIEVPFRGRFLKIPGDRTFEAWTATFYNTKDFNLRKAFELWINAGNKTDENIGTLDFGAIGGNGNYFCDMIVQQKAKDATTDVLREYRLVGAWPTNVGAINLAYDSNDQIEEFSVEWQYSYFTAEGGTRSGVSNLGVV